jgi:starch synthase
MVSSEAAPLAKSGGLADVVGALPAALRRLNDDVAVLIPRYAGIDLKTARRVYDSLPIYLGLDRYDTSVYQAPAEFPFYLLDCPPLYDRPGLYGEAGVDYPDNHIRFAVLARAALSVARFLFRTEIFHCHDWQAGLVSAYLRGSLAIDPSFIGAKSVFTIHNLAYQGLFPKTVLPEIAVDPALFRPDGVEFYGQVSYIKSGVALADWLTTVSPTYASEIQTPELGCGLDGALRARSGVLSGILNGVDYQEWNPETDPYLPANYSAEDLSGKQICKQALLQEFGLPPDVADRPLFGIVSRFTLQKGTDLIAQILGDLAAEGGCLVAIGSGEPQYEEPMLSAAAAHPGSIAVRIGYDNGLAHRIEAGSDIFLMPSRYEPCGLNQIYSIRYGTPPVVHVTGGLNDTIDEDTGFRFTDYSSRGLVDAVRGAIQAFGDRDGWVDRMRRGMTQDFSWNASAAAYSALYRRLLGQVVA